MQTHTRWNGQLDLTPDRLDERRGMQMLSWLLVPAYLAVVGVVLWALHGLAGAL